MFVRVCWLLCLTVWSAAVEHQMPQGYRCPEGGILSDDLTTSLEVPDKPVVVGSAWVVHYVVHNTGTTPLVVTSDFDGYFPRPTRIWLEAIGPDGVFAADPLAHKKIPGQLGSWMDSGNPSVSPSGSRVFTVIPRRYIRLDRPGRWTLRLFHDLGMGRARDGFEPRWATATIDVVMPDAAQAEAVLIDHETRLTQHVDPKIERRPAAADFPAMELPIYLPLLDARARAGSRYAIQGLAMIPTMEATESLLDILARRPLPAPPAEKPLADLHPWVSAFHALARRLPPTEFQRRIRGSTDPRFLTTLDEKQKERATLAARAARYHGPEVRDAAAAFLSRSQPVAGDKTLGEWEP